MRTSLSCGSIISLTISNVISVCSVVTGGIISVEVAHGGSSLPGWGDDEVAELQVLPSKKGVGSV